MSDTVDNMNQKRKDSRLAEAISQSKAVDSGTQFPTNEVKKLKELRETMNTILENRSSGSRYSAKNNLHHATFYCMAPEAEHVALSGDFNHWHSTPMTRMPDGRWMASLELPHGYHHYIFLVDDKRVLDPNAYGIVRDAGSEPVSLMALS